MFFAHFSLFNIMMSAEMFDICRGFSVSFNSIKPNYKYSHLSENGEEREAQVTNRQPSRIFQTSAMNCEGAEL
jgi:hypothetical protein